MTFKIQETTITVDLETNKLLTSRIINGKLWKLVVTLKANEVSGLADFVAKCERIAKLGEGMYKELSMISELGA